MVARKAEGGQPLNDHAGTCDQITMRAVSYKIFLVSFEHCLSSRGGRTADWVGLPLLMSLEL